jgi:hypothetical protein
MGVLPPAPAGAREPGIFQRPTPAAHRPDAVAAQGVEGITGGEVVAAPDPGAAQRANVTNSWRCPQGP